MSASSRAIFNNLTRIRKCSAVCETTCTLEMLERCTASLRPTAREGYTRLETALAGMGFVLNRKHSASHEVAEALKAAGSRSNGPAGKPCGLEAGQRAAVVCRNPYPHSLSLTPYTDKRAGGGRRRRTTLRRDVFRSRQSDLVIISRAALES